MFSLDILVHIGAFVFLIAYLAGLAAGMCPEPTGISQQWVLEKRFEPKQSGDHADTLYAGWQRAVARLLHDPGV